MFNIWKLSNAFLQTGRSSLICCDVRYCWNQIFSAVGNNRTDSRTVDTQTPEDKQLKFKKCSNSEPNTAKHLIEPSLFLSSVNALKLLKPNASDEYPSYEDGDQLYLEASDYILVDQADKIHPYRITQPDDSGHDRILYVARQPIYDEYTMTKPSEEEQSNLINPGSKSKDDEDRSYIINIFLNNRKASDDDSVNVCLNDLEIKADEVCMQKLMRNIQKNYSTIDQICQSSANFEECKTRLSQRLEEVWRKVFKQSKANMNKNLAGDINAKKEEVENKFEGGIKQDGMWTEQEENRVNIIVNYEKDLREKSLERDQVKNETEKAAIVNLSATTLQVEEKNTSEANTSENISSIMNVAPRHQVDKIENEEIEKQIQFRNITQENYNKTSRDETKDGQFHAPANIVPAPAGLITDKISNDYIKKKLEMVEEKIDALAEVHKMLKDQLKHDTIKIEGEIKQIAKTHLLGNRKEEIIESVETIEEPQKKNDVIILNSKTAKEMVKEEKIETENDSGTDEITQKCIQTRDDKVVKNVSNDGNNKESDGKDRNKTTKNENIRETEQSPASNLKLQNKDDKPVTSPPTSLDTNPTSKSVSKPSNQELLEKFILQQNMNRNINRKTAKKAKDNEFKPPPVKDVTKPRANLSSQEMLEKFIRQQNMNKNTNRKTVKKAKDNEFTPKDSDNNKKPAGNSQKVKESKSKFQVKKPETITRSAFKRNNERLHRYNEQQLEQMDTIIKLASAPSPQSTVSKMMHFWKGFFKEEDQGLSKSTNTTQEEDYIDRRMRATKLYTPDTHQMQYRSLMPENISDMPPQPIKSATDIKNSEFENIKDRGIGSMNRTDDVIQHQKLYQQKSGIRERMLPFSGGNTFGGGQKASYRTNFPEIRLDQQKKTRLNIKDKILNIFRGQKRHFSTKDDCHKDDECCENAKSSGKRKCKEVEEEDPCAKKDPCDAVEEKYRKTELNCCQTTSCGTRDEEDCDQKAKSSAGSECKEEKDSCAKMESEGKSACAESKVEKPDPFDEIEEKYRKTVLKCCQPTPCRPRDEEDDDECFEPKSKCETAAEMKKLRKGVIGCTGKCLVNRDSDEAPDPEPIQEPCPKKNDCDPRQDTVVEAEIPKCDIMDNIGHFISKDACDDAENYYADNGYKNMEYYKNKPFTYYDINQYLATKRNPQPNPSGKIPPKKKEPKTMRKRKIKKTSCTC